MYWEILQGFEKKYENIWKNGWFWKEIWENVQGFEKKYENIWKNGWFWKEIWENVQDLDKILKSILKTLQDSAKLFERISGFLER